MLMLTTLISAHEPLKLLPQVDNQPSYGVDPGDICPGCRGYIGGGYYFPEKPANPTFTGVDIYDVNGNFIAHLVVRYHSGVCIESFADPYIICGPFSHCLLEKQIYITAIADDAEIGDLIFAFDGQIVPIDPNGVGDYPLVTLPFSDEEKYPMDPNTYVGKRINCGMKFKIEVENTRTGGVGFCNVRCANCLDK